MDILTQQRIPDREYFRDALESHRGAAERCRAMLRYATTEAERESAREQLVSALGEIERWQARLEACNA